MKLSLAALSHAQRGVYIDSILHPEKLADVTAHVQMGLAKEARNLEMKAKMSSKECYFGQIFGIVRKDNYLCRAFL